MSEIINNITQVNFAIGANESIAQELVKTGSKTPGEFLINSDTGAAYLNINNSDTLRLNIGQNDQGEYSEIFNDYINNQALGAYSHVEGKSNMAKGAQAHVEGESNIANGNNTHISGYQNIANANNQFVCGLYNENKDNTLFEVGNGIAETQERTNAFEVYQDGHAELPNLKQIDGTLDATAVGDSAFSVATKGYVDSVQFERAGEVGQRTTQGGEIFNHYQNQAGMLAHAENGYTQALGDYSHAEGHSTLTKNEAAHAEGYQTEASGKYSHTEGEYTKASGQGAHAEGATTGGEGTQAIGDGSHAEGLDTVAQGNAAHSEGVETKALGAHSHAEGAYTKSSGQNAHSEGYVTIAEGETAHAEGYNTLAQGAASHAEGINTKSVGAYSHASGNGTIAEGIGSYTVGEGTHATQDYQLVCGQYNEILDDVGGNVILFEVGNGSEDMRSTAMRVLTNGSATIAYVNPNNPLSVANVDYINKHFIFKDGGTEVDLSSYLLRSVADQSYYSALDGQDLETSVSELQRFVSTGGAYVIDTAYPVGAIWCGSYTNKKDDHNATYRSPLLPPGEDENSSTLTYWRLQDKNFDIGKSFKALNYAETTINNYFTPEANIKVATTGTSSTDSYFLAAFYNGHEITINMRLTLTGPLTIADADQKKLGKFTLSAFGIQGDIERSLFTSQFSDNGNLLLSYSLNTDGTLQLYDISSWQDGTWKHSLEIATGSEINVELTFNIPIRTLSKMDNNFCDKFYYQRTKLINNNEFDDNGGTSNAQSTWNEF